jgi:hypothetical protein
MDGVEFFSAGLRTISLGLKPVGDGTCAVHNGPATLYDLGQHRVCRGCILLRQTYPVAARGKEGKARFGLGCYMLITAQTTDYWGKHIMPKEITVHQATGALRDLVRKLILDPPTPPWMFMSFARSNYPDRLLVTTTNDLMQFAGKFFMPGTVDQPPVQRLNRKGVIALHRAADLTRPEWEQFVRAHAALHASNDTLPYLREVYERFPDLAKVSVPAERTPEYNAVRLIAREK